MKLIDSSVTRIFIKISHDPTLAIQKLIKFVLSEGLVLDYITKDLFDFMFVEFPRVPVFYVLPKIHKPGFPPRGCPIVAAQFSLFENISKYVDSLLQPFVTALSTYIRDTTDFIQKVEGILVPKEAIIVSFDVASLYTNIPLEDAREVVQYYLSQNNDEDRPPVQYVLQLVDLLLEKNYFKYGEQFFYQIKGVSMGSSFPPSLANLFMACLEENFILNPEANPFRAKIKVFWRYIDDCFCVFTDPLVLDQFMDWMNQIHPSIEFTVEGSTSEAHFLDMFVFKDIENKLAIRPFIKPTDRNNYLHFSSYHRRNLKVNIPYSQFLRLKRNASTLGDYQHHAKRLKQQFLESGYPLDVINTAAIRANQRTRESLFIQQRKDEGANRLRWALDHTP